MRLHVYTRIHTYKRIHAQNPLLGTVVLQFPVSSLSSTNISVFVFDYSMRKKEKERKREGEKEKERGGEKERESRHSRILLHHIFYVRQNCLTIAWSINIQCFRVSFKTELPLFTIAEIQMSQFISFVYVCVYASI